MSDPPAPPPDADAVARPISRWRTFGTPRCPRTFPEIPYVAQRETRSGTGCDCWDCVEIRTERERDFLKEALVTATQAQEIAEWNVKSLTDHLNRTIDALNAAESALAAAEQARQDADPSGDRDFIEKKFREGMREAEVSDPAICPYEEHSLAGHWWTRGFASQSRNLRAIVAEQARADAERELQHLRSRIQFVFLGGGPLEGTAQEQFSKLCEVVDKERFDAEHARDHIEQQRDQWRAWAEIPAREAYKDLGTPFGPWFRAALSRL